MDVQHFLGFDLNHAANGATGHKLFHFPVKRRVAKNQTDGQRYARRIRGVDHTVGPFRRYGYRLFEQDRQTGFKRANSDHLMAGVVSRYDEGVQLRSAIEQFVYARIPGGCRHAEVFSVAI